MTCRAVAEICARSSSPSDIIDGRPAASAQLCACSMVAVCLRCSSMEDVFKTLRPMWTARGCGIQAGVARLMSFFGPTTLGCLQLLLRS